MHGIMYVPESEMSQDPLETEGMRVSFLLLGGRQVVLTCAGKGLTNMTITSSSALRGFGTGKRRAVLHHCQGASSPEYRRKHQRPGKMVEYLPAGRAHRRGGFSSLVAKEIF